MLTHHHAAPRDPQRVVVLGAGGFLGRALTMGMVQAGLPTLTLRRDDLDLAGQTAGEALADLLRPDDAVIMLAAITPDKGRGVGTFMTNLRMGASLCAAAEKVKLSHCVYFSTAAVYPTSDRPATEDTPPQPADLFGMMHLAREMMIRTGAGCPVAIVRPTQVHGPVSRHQTHGRNLAYGPNLMRQIARDNGRIVLAGGGQDRRDFIAIQDVVDLTLRLVRHRSHGLINFATGRSLSIAEAARQVAELFDPPVPVELTERFGAAAHRVFDIANLTRAFPDFVFSDFRDALIRAHVQDLQP